MGRPKGSKNRPKDNGHDDPAAEGHNSRPELSDDEKRALTLHHVRRYQEAEARVEAAKDERREIVNLAKADLGKGALGDIKDLIMFEDPTKLSATMERTMRLARWKGLPIGHQAALFEPTVDHFEEGKTAGCYGETCTPPEHLSAQAGQKWIQGWHAGQSTLHDALKKRMAAANVGHADTSDRPFA